MSATVSIVSVTPDRGKLTAWMPTASHAMTHTQKWISCDSMHSPGVDLSFHFDAHAVSEARVNFAWMDESETEQKDETALRLRAWGSTQLQEPYNNATRLNAELVDATCRTIGEVSYTIVWNMAKYHTEHFGAVTASDIVTICEYITSTNDRLRTYHQQVPRGLSKWTNCDERLFVPYKQSQFRYMPQAMFFAHACMRITTESAQRNQASLERLVEVAVHRVGEPRTFADWCSLLTETCAMLPLSMAYELDNQADFLRKARYTRTKDHHKPHCVSRDDDPDQWDHPLCYPSCSEIAGDCEDMAATALTVWKLLSCVEVARAGPGQVHDTFDALVLLAKALLVMPTICILKDGSGFTYHATVFCTDAGSFNANVTRASFERKQSEERFMREVMHSDAAFPPTAFFVECTEHMNPTVVDTKAYGDLYERVSPITDMAHVRIPTFSQHEDTGYKAICSIFGSHLPDSPFLEAHCLTHGDRERAWVDPRDLLDPSVRVTLDGTVRTPSLDAAFARVGAQLPPLSRLPPPPHDRTLPDYDKATQLMATRRFPHHDMQISGLQCQRHDVAILQGVDCVEYIYSDPGPDST